MADTVLERQVKTKPQRPKEAFIIILDDDVTKMDTAARVLKHDFGKTHDEAWAIVREITKTKGTYRVMEGLTWEIAIEMADRGMRQARKHQPNAQLIFEANLAP